MPYIFLFFSSPLFFDLLHAILGLISSEEYFLESSQLTHMYLPSLYMGWGNCVQTLGTENFTLHELSDESCHCCDTWSSVSQRACAVGLYMCSICIDETTLKELHSLSSRAPFCLKTISMKLHVDIIYSATFLIPVRCVQVAARF